MLRDGSDVYCTPFRQRHSAGSDLLDPDGGDPVRPASAESDHTEHGDVTVGYMTQLQQVGHIDTFSLTGQVGWRRVAAFRVTR